MAAAERLLGVGVHPEVAKRVGFFMPATIIAAGGALGGPGNYIARVSTGGTSVALDANFDLGDIVIIAAGVTASVYPAAADSIFSGGAGAVRSVEAGVARAFVKVDANTWFVLTSA